MSQTCRYCHAPIIWITTAKNHKPMICAAQPIIRDGSEPPAKGMYIDAKGNVYHEEDVPCKIQVWKTHWAECPGRDKARRKDDTTEEGTENSYQY